MLDDEDPAAAPGADAPAVTDGDIEWVRHVVVAGQQFIVVLTPDDGKPDPLRDPQLELFSEGGELLAISSISGSRDARLAYLPPENGVVFIRVGGQNVEAAGFILTIVAAPDDDLPGSAETDAVIDSGDDAEPVRGVIDFEGDRDWFRVDLTAGDTYVFRADGDPGSAVPAPGASVALVDADGAVIEPLAFGADVSFAAVEDGEAFIEVFGDSGPGDYVLSLKASRDLPADVSTPSMIVPGEPTYGRIDYPRDADWHALAVEAGRSYTIRVSGDDRGGSPLLFQNADLRDASGAVLASDSDRDGVMQYVAAEDGVVFVTVSSFIGRSDYAIDVEQDAPTLSLIVGGSGTEQFKPSFLLEVDGVSFGRFTIDDPVQGAFAEDDPANYRRIDVALDGGRTPDSVRIVFDTDVYLPKEGIDVNLYVDAIEILGKRIEAEDHGVFVAARARHVPVEPRSDLLWNGAQTFDDIAALVADPFL